MIKFSNVCLYIIESDVSRWSTEDVGAWLTSLGLAEYSQLFIRNDIRGAELLHLQRQDLKVSLYYRD